MPSSYSLSPTAIDHLRQHKRWSMERFGETATKKYFQELDERFQYIADNHQRFQKRLKLTGKSGLAIYPAREHYVVYIPIDDDVHIVGIFGQMQDIPRIIEKNCLVFQQELDRYKLPLKKGSNKNSANQTHPPTLHID